MAGPLSQMQPGQPAGQEDVPWYQRRVYVPAEGKESAVADFSNQCHRFALVAHIPVAYGLGNLVHLWGQGNWLTLIGHTFAGIQYTVSYAVRSTDGESADVRQKEAAAAACHLAAAMPRYLEHKTMKYVGLSSWSACVMATYYCQRWVFYSMAEED